MKSIHTKKALERGNKLWFDFSEQRKGTKSTKICFGTCCLDTCWPTAASDNHSPSADTERKRAFNPPARGLTVTDTRALPLEPDAACLSTRKGLKEIEKSCLIRDHICLRGHNSPRELRRRRRRDEGPPDCRHCRRPTACSRRAIKPRGNRPWP